MHVPSLKPSDTNAEWAEVVAPRQLLPGTPAFMRRRITELEADLADTLRAVLFHFGPEGAKKVTDSVIEQRTKRI